MRQLEQPGGRPRGEIDALPLGAEAPWASIRDGLSRIPLLALQQEPAVVLCVRAGCDPCRAISEGVRRLSQQNVAPVPSSAPCSRPGETAPARAHGRPLRLIDCVHSISIRLVVPRARISSGGRPRRWQVRVSTSPSRRLAAAAGYASSSPGTAPTHQDPNAGQTRTPERKRPPLWAPLSEASR